MAGKVFELEQVLMYRREMEKIRKLDFATAKHELDLANHELKRSEDLVDLLNKEFQCSQKDIGSIDEMRMYSDFFARKREEIKQLKDQIVELDHIVDDKRDELMEASKDKKVLESLKEKKAEEFKLEMAIKERNFLDEISIQKKVETT
jgi:flagellar FliJ protein